MVGGSLPLLLNVCSPDFTFEFLSACYSFLKSLGLLDIFAYSMLLLLSESALSFMCSLKALDYPDMPFSPNNC